MQELGKQLKLRSLFRSKSFQQSIRNNKQEQSHYGRK